MEILLWLVPPVVVTVVAMAWVSWLGREGRGEVDRDVAVRRLAEALQREGKTLNPGRQALRTPDRDRSTGVAVRRSRAPSVPAGPDAPARRSA